MKSFGNFVQWFLYITVGIMLVCAVGYKAYGAETVSTDIFFEILAAAFFTALITTFLSPKEGDGKTAARIKIAIHYFALWIIMCVIGIKFEWINANPKGIGMMAVYVGAVYLFTFLATCIAELKKAEEINERLKEKYGDEK